jgi:hypothetical protein
MNDVTEMAEEAEEACPAVPEDVLDDQLLGRSATSSAP